MFNNGGYFRGVSCPFYASGLCERPYCHFRHVKTEEEHNTGRRGGSYVESLSEKSWLGPTGSYINNTCENANGQGIRINKYTGKPEPVTGPEEYQIPHTVSVKYDINGVNVNKYTGQPIRSTKPEEYQVEGSGYGNTKVVGHEEYHIPGTGYGGPNGKLTQPEEYEIHGSGYGNHTGKQRSNKLEEYSVEGSGYGKCVNSPVIEEYQVDGEGYGKFKDKMKKMKESKLHSAKPDSKSGICPEYNPTPIDKLKPGNESAKYTTEDSSVPCSEQEYDPMKNFSTGLGLNLHKTGPVKRTYSYDPTKPNFGCPKKKVKLGKDKGGLPKFGESESEDDGEIGAFSEEEEEVKEEASADMEEEEDDSEEEDKPALITDVKVFESLLMDSKDLEEDKEKMLSTDAESDQKSESLESDKQQQSVKSKTKEDNTKSSPKSKLDGSHSRDRGIFKALAKLSDTMSKMKKSDLFSKNLGIKDSSASTSHKNDDSTSHSKEDKISSSKSDNKKSHKSSSSSSSSKDKSSSTHKSLKEKSLSKEKSSSKESSSSKEKSSSSKKSSSKDRSSSKDKSSLKSISTGEKSSSKSSKEHNTSSKHRSSSSSKHKSSSSSSHSSSHKDKHDKDKHDKDKHTGKSEDRNHKHHKSSGSNKHHSSEKHSDKVKCDKNASQSHHNSSKSRERKSSNQERRDSTDSSHSRRSSVDKQKIVDLNVNLFGEDSENEPDEVGVMSDFSDDSDLVSEEDLVAEDPYEECLKIFKENATKLNYTAKKSFTKAKEELPVVVGKKRTAHKTDVEVKRKVPERPFSKLSPAQVMHNRFLAIQKAALEAEKTAEKDKAIPSTSTSSDSSGGKKRVAPSAFSAAACGTRVVDGKTVMATASKSNKRKAHTPNVPNIKRPTIPSEFGSKVPTNVRQRYLNSIIDECLKICPSEEEAFKRGQEEESVVYSRSTSKTVYLNVAINTIKRLRNEASENSPSKAKKVSPMKISHEAVLGGKNAVRNTYTLNRSASVNVAEIFKGAELYKRLERYILKEEQLKENGFPRTDPDDSSKVKLYTESLAQQNSAKLKLHEKICSRCGKRFMVFPNGTYANKEECTYHWGKAWKKKIAGAIDTRYTCCQGDLGSEGCQIAQYHVHETNKWENLSGFMKTIPCSPSLDGDYGVYAMDCEMVYTQGGIELARVTVIDQDNASVYETLVRPDRKVIDYNTRFSGITMEDMRDVRTSLRDVQAVLLSLFTDKTILVGHSLESDLFAVKLIHNTVVDTSVVFPHRLGPPYKRALKTLMAEYLKKIIQDDVEGHDSREDAVACMDLMRWRVKEDAKKERHL
ncbi:hypothetical protein FSP39_009745 [Pinctada imbricata]|uniref:C3H1-type domain-containing protein n=1 Tax=Pinctada imbricata TaxID=66713 RepID=A0AA89BQE8_PINIB|nr:hypothetical protein FSP39_009745 [Pinctada imbricata]